MDENGVPTLVLDTETDQQLVVDYITEQDVEKYFVQPEEQEDKDETETISITSMADYDHDEVEASLTAIADAFHKIGNEYEHLCSMSHICPKPKQPMLSAGSLSSPLWERTCQSKQNLKWNREDPNL